MEWKQAIAGISRKQENCEKQTHNCSRVLCQLCNWHLQIGGYAAVLFVLGMIDRLSDLVDAAHDLTSRQLIDEQLPKRIHLPNRKKWRKQMSSKEVIVSISCGGENIRVGRLWFHIRGTD